MPTDNPESSVDRSHLEISYRLSPDDCVLEVDPGWSGFAQSNSAPGLDPNSVIGRPVWDFISGVEVRAIYQRLFDEVRSTQKALSVAFRCDSPGEIRNMSLTIEPLPLGQLGIVSSLVERLRREPVELLEAGTARSDEMVSLCSWCKRVESADGEWLEIEQSTWPRSAALLPRVSHGICPNCEGTIASELGHLAPDSSD